MKKYIFLLLFIFFYLFIVHLSLADTLQIPFSCWPLELKEKFSGFDRKLDLNPNDRTKDSWGFIDSHGSNFDIVTYRSATQEDLKIIQKIVSEIEISHKE